LFTAKLLGRVRQKMLNIGLTAALHNLNEDRTLPAACMLEPKFAG
jgi:hypothetical protein